MPTVLIEVRRPYTPEREMKIPKSHVKIVLREQPHENWGIRGGLAACDVDLGFKVDV